MFNKKICGRCGKGSKEKYSFCPYCGNPLEKKKKDLGMLGQHDFEPGLGNSNAFGNPARGILGANGFGGFNMIFNSLMKNLEKQFREENQKGKNPNQNVPGNGISISISTFGNGMPMMGQKPQNQGNENRKKKHAENRKFFFDNFNSEGLKKYSGLPKEEPKTNLKRMDNKIFYEVELPGVKSARDISIVNLEKSMELKAVAEDRAYKKVIPMNFPISDYKLLKGKLVLEMDAQGN